LGPVKAPVDGSNSQPLFATGYPDSGASFSCIVVSLMRAWAFSTKIECNTEKRWAPPPGSTVEENVISVNRYILLSSILDENLNQADDTR
jgi:hypothetical protein